MSTTEQPTSVTWNILTPSDGTESATMMTSSTMVKPPTRTPELDRSTMIKDDVVSTIAQISTQNSNLKIIIGVTIVVVLLVVTGIVVAIIVAVVCKKRGKSIGTYPLPGKKSQSNGAVNIASNGVGKSNDSFCFQ